MAESPSRRSFLRWAALGAAGGLAGCRARGLDVAAGRLPLASDGAAAVAPAASGAPPAPSGATMPTAFVGHGSPMTVLDPVRGAIWTRWAQAMPRPRAILCVSAHWEENPLTVGTTVPLPLVYDYYGFPDEMYRVTYPSPGAPALADQVERLVAPVRRVARDPERGLDHGAFAPLTWLYPRADVPVLEMSIPTDDPRALFAVGRALAPLRREGVLILGSGNVTHNLGRISRDGDAPPSWAADFDAWTADVLGRGDVDALLDWTQRAPAPRMNHPTSDHWLPMYVVAGAADGARATFPVTGWEGGSLSRRCVQFG